MTSRLSSALVSQKNTLLERGKLMASLWRFVCLRIAGELQRAYTKASVGFAGGSVMQLRRVRG